jgi:TatD DNase family protein
MQFEYFDIHSHLNFSQYDADRESIIARLLEKKIGTITVGTDITTSKEAVELATNHEHLFAAIGIHPADNPESLRSEGFNEKEFTKLVTHPKVVAIGECGLDYFRLSQPEIQKKKQKESFEQQIHFAVLHNKPLMIHCRDAYPDTIEILKSKQKEFGEKVRGNFHFFTSPIEIAKQCLGIGFTVSFTGPITYGSDYDRVVEFVPLTSMMIETDAPFAAPVPYRGKRNEPAYVEYIAQKVANIKRKNIDEVKKALVNNVLHHFFRKS